MSFLRKIKNAVFQYFRFTNRALLLLCILASVYGVVLVYSAVHTYPTGPRTFLMQALASLAGLIAAVILSKIDYDTICRFWPVYAAGAFVLVFLTYTPLGLQVPGTDDTAWLSIPLIGTFQPSELMKIVFIITFSKHLVTVRDHINRPLTVLLLCLHGALPVLMVLKQGDDGTALVFMLIFVAMLFAAGLKPLYFLIAAVGGTAAVPVVWNLLTDDKKARFLSLVKVDEYLMDEGWQQYLALRAMGSGQLWGTGYLEGGGSEMYSLYARNNDFIFTVAGEEFGFIGSLALLLILILIVTAILKDALGARDRLGMYLCVGVMAMIGFQSMINIGMVVRLLPVIGITLPFFSAGGSSVAMLYLGIGLVLSVHYSSRARSDNSIFYKKQ
mgnify:CR=1 FL=1